MADPIVEELQLDISPALDALTPLASALGDLTTGFSSSLADALTSALGTPIPGDQLVDTASLTTAVEGALTDATSTPLPIEGDTTALDASLTESLDTPHTTPVDADVSALDATLAAATDIPHTVPIDGETSALDATVAGALDTPHTIPVDGDATQLDAAISDATDATRTVPIAADVAEATTAIDGLTGTPIEIPVTADTGPAQDSIDQLSSSASGATDSLSGLSGGVDALKGATGLATGSTSELAGTISNVGTGAAVAVSGVLAFGAVISESVSLAADAEAQNKRFAATFGEVADQVKQIDVGGLTISLKDLATQSGTSSSDLEATASRIGQLGISSGAAKPAVADITDKILAMGAAIAVNNPRLGDAATVSDNLASAFVRGGRALLPYGISLTAAQIATEAMKETSKSTSAELTIFDKITAGANLAAAQFGDTLGTKFKEGSQSAQVQLAALKQSLEETLVAIGGPLLAPLVTSLQAVVPVAQEVGQTLGALGAVIFPLIASVAPAVGALAAPLGLVTDGLNGIAGAITHFSVGSPIVVAALGALYAAALVGAYGIDALTTAFAEATVAFATSPFGATILAVAALGFALDRLGGSTDGAKEAAKTFSDALFGTGAGVDGLTGQLVALDSNLDKTLTKLIETGSLAEFRAALDSAGGGVEGLRTALLGSNAEFGKYADAVGQAAAANGNFFIDGARAKVALEDQRKGLIETEKQQLANLVSTNQLTDEQRKAAEEQNKNTDGTINYVNVLKQVAPEIAHTAEANQTNATATAFSSGEVKKATDAFLAHKIGAEELKAKLLELGVATDDATQFSKAMGDAQQKTADNLKLASPAAQQLAADFTSGRISEEQFVAGLHNLQISTGAVTTEMSGLSGAMDSFIKKVNAGLPSLDTALKGAEQGVTSAQQSQKSALEALTKNTESVRDRVDKAYEALAFAHEKGGKAGATAVTNAQHQLEVALHDGGAKISDAQAAVQKANDALAAATDPARVIENLQKGLTQITDFQANLQKIVSAGGVELAASLAAQGAVAAGAEAAGFAASKSKTQLAEAIVGQNQSATTTLDAWVRANFGDQVASAFESQNPQISAAVHPDFVTPTKKQVDAANAVLHESAANLANNAKVMGTAPTLAYAGGLKFKQHTTDEVTHARQVIEAAKNPHGAAAKALAADATGKYGGALGLPGATSKNVGEAGAAFNDGQAHLNLLNQASAAGHAAGFEFDKGLAGGISQNTGLIESAASTAAGKAETAAKKRLGVSSPSTVGREIGDQFSEGVALGINAKAPLVTKASEDLTALIVTSLDVARVSALSLDVHIPPVPLELTPTIGPIAPIAAPVTLVPDVHSIPAVHIDAQVRPVLAPIPLQVAELELQPRLDPIAKISALSAEVQVHPVLDPLPDLKTTAEVVPTIDTLPRLSTSVAVHPTVDPLPALDTTAAVHPTIDALPALTTTATVTPTVGALPTLATSADVTLNVGALPNLSLTAAVQPIVPDLADVALTADVTATVPPLPNADLIANVHPTIPTLANADLTAIVHPTVPALAPTTLQASVLTTVPPLPVQQIHAVVTPTIEIPPVAIENASRALTASTKTAILTGFNDPATIAAAQDRLAALIARDQQAAAAAAALAAAQQDAASKAAAALQALQSFVSSSTGQLPTASAAISTVAQNYSAAMDKLGAATFAAQQSSQKFGQQLKVQQNEIAKANKELAAATAAFLDIRQRAEANPATGPEDSWVTQPQLNAALVRVQQAQQRISDAQKRIKDQMIETGKLQGQLAATQKELAIAADPARFSALQGAIDRAAKTLFIDTAHHEALRTLVRDKIELTRAQSALAGFLSTTPGPNINAFIADLKKQNAAVKAFQDDIAALVSEGDTKLAEQLAQAGPEAAAALADAFAKSPAKAAAANAAIIQGQAYSDAFSTFLGTTFKDDFTPVATDAGTTAGKAILFGVKDALADPAAGLSTQITASLPQSIAVPVTVTPTVVSPVGPIGTFPTTAPIAVGPTGAGVGAQTFILDLTVLIDGVPTKVAPVTLTVPTPPPSKLTQRVTAEVSAG